MTIDEDVARVRAALARVQGEINTGLVCEAWESLDRIAAAAAAAEKTARERWAGYSPPRLPNQDRIDAAVASLHAALSPESRAALAAGLESARRGEIRPLDLSWMPPVELGDFDDE